MNKEWFNSRSKIDYFEKRYLVICAVLSVIGQRSLLNSTYR